MLTDLLLFPGVVFHELAHLLMCLLLSVKVTRFKISLTGGFVEHVSPSSIIKSLLVATAPFIAALIAALIMLNIYTSGFYAEALKLYFSFVILYSSFPSLEDTNFQKYHNLLKKILTFPFFVILRLEHLLGKSSQLKTVYAAAMILIVYNI